MLVPVEEEAGKVSSAFLERINLTIRRQEVDSSLDNRLDLVLGMVLKRMKVMRMRIVVKAEPRPTMKEKSPFIPNPPVSPQVPASDTPNPPSHVSTKALTLK